MKAWQRTATVAAAAGTILALPSIASAATRPTWLSGGQHSCSYTAPEYMLSDWDMAVHAYPGTTRFTATHTSSRGNRYEDAYWVTGWHDENSSICDKRTIPHSGGRKASSLKPGFLDGPQVSANFSAHGSGRIGFDLWLTATTSEHSPTQMEHDSRTWEVLLQPGGGAYRDNPGWHRAYIGIGGRAGSLNVYGLNLTALARKAGVPRWYSWAAIDAGGETPSGSFTVSSYYLHIGGQHTVVSKPKPAPKPVKKAPPKRKATPKIVRRWVPYVRGERLSVAIAKIRRAGFTHIHAPRPVRGHVVIITSQSRRAYANVKTFAIYLHGRKK